MLDQSVDDAADQHAVRIVIADGDFVPGLLVMLRIEITLELGRIEDAPSLGGQGRDGLRITGQFAMQPLERAGPGRRRRKHFEQTMEHLAACKSVVVAAGRGWVGVAFARMHRRIVRPGCRRAW